MSSAFVLQLHFTEPAAYAEIYNSPHRMRKEPDFYENGLVFAGLPSNIFHVSNPRAHSAIKSLFSSYFTKKTVLKLEAVVQERVDKLISQLLKNHKTSPVDMNHAYHSVSLDVISLYALRTSVDATSFPSFKHPAVVSVEETIGAIWVMRHFQRLRRISIMLPRWLTLYLMPAVKPQLQIRDEIERLVDIAMADSENHDGEADRDDLNVFYTILRNARVDGRLKNSSWVTRDQMIAEAMGFRVAGSDTIGNTCTVATWYLIRDDDIRGKLVKELTTAWPDKEKTMPLELLEKLPYLVRLFITVHGTKLI
ncbi:hypothetical protein VNI00_005492 [Paramarasmius palmivorus]|uniref:Cytochrome P450 n=1 Tax=Paramarasmius palmivorus TaxID=297713 RepID=A0AAW0DEA1_9AGAR